MLWAFICSFMSISELTQPWRERHIFVIPTSYYVWVRPFQLILFSNQEKWKYRFVFVTYTSFWIADNNKIFTMYSAYVSLSFMQYQKWLIVDLSLWFKFSLFFWKSKVIKVEITILYYKNTKWNVKTHRQRHMAEQNTRINRLVRDI